MIIHLVDSEIVISEEEEKANGCVLQVDYPKDGIITVKRIFNERYPLTYSCLYSFPASRLLYIDWENKQKFD